MKESNTPKEKRNGISIPHKGSLCKLVLQSTDHKQKQSSSSTSVAIYSISLKDSQQLHFTTQDYQFLCKIFKCLDRNSMGYVHKLDLEDFCEIRCPFDRIHNETNFDITTFDKIWNLVLELQHTNHIQSSDDIVCGLEAFMIFSKFISLVQYQDARRKFRSAKKNDVHISKRENSQTEEEQMIMIDLPPLEPEKPLSMESMLAYEAELLCDQQHTLYDDKHTVLKNGRNMIGNGLLIPLPELDLDHSFSFIHDDVQCKTKSEKHMTVTVSVFSPTSEPTSDIEFILRTRMYFESQPAIDDIIVKRSFSDIEWLHQNLKSHRQLGGTLCGRILPPFPNKVVTTTTCMDYEVESNRNSSLPTSFGSTAIVNSLPAKTAVIEAASKTGKGILNLASKTAKSLLRKAQTSSGNQKESEFHDHLPCSSKQTTVVNMDGNSQSQLSSIRSSKKSFMPPAQDILVLKAKQVERYLNYLLENPAFSSSFSLRMILTSSQSGLEAAKELLDEEGKKAGPGLTTTNETEHISSTRSDIGDINKRYQSLAFQRSLKKYLMRYPSDSNDFGWLRTAAQAALVLNVDSLLETAGYQSTSTKLQHASLPKLAPSRNLDAHRMDQDNMNPGENNSSIIETDYEYKNDSDFEGFDLLPDPLPLSERSALCAKKSPKVSVAPITGFIYSDMKYSQNRTILGEIDIERDVQSLYDLLKKVDNSLDQCCAAVNKIGEARRLCSMSQMSILQCIDSWQGMRGQIIMQRFLLNAMSSLKSSNHCNDESLGAFSQDMVWNASLASASKLACKVVKCAAEAARVAKKAKQTAEGAVSQALGELRTDIYKTPEEEGQMKEKLASLRMQALHAAVVEHETAVAKRKAAVSLANDVKYWNSHRKRSLLDACMNMTRAQLGATKEELKAWCQLRDGILSSPNDLFVQEKIVLQDHELDMSRDLDDRASHDGFGMGTESPLKHQEENIRIDDYFGTSQSKDVVSVYDSVSSSFKENQECDFDNGCQNTTSNFNVHNTFDVKGQNEGEENTDLDQSRIRDSDEMSESMQSLVEGLLSWGENWEADEEFNMSQVRLPSLAVNSDLLQ